MLFGSFSALVLSVVGLVFKSPSPSGLYPILRGLVKEAQLLNDCGKFWV